LPGICLAIALVLAVLKFAGVAVIATFPWWAIAVIAVIGFAFPFIVAGAIALAGGLVASLVFFVAFVAGVFGRLGRKFK
jgi:hypothetical protein